jgi:hypothetical protein
MVLFWANGKMFNDVPSYRVGKEIRAHLKGSLSSPTSITRKGTSNLKALCHPKNSRFNVSLDTQFAHTNYDITRSQLKEIV